MHVTAKADYANPGGRAASRQQPGAAVQGGRGRAGPGYSPSFLKNILTQLRTAGVVRSQRGPEGGYWLARPPDELNIAHIIRAVEGPLVGVRGQPPEEIEYVGPAESLQQVWIALRANLRKVLEHVTISDVAAGKLPKDVLALTREEEAWETR